MEQKKQIEEIAKILNGYCKANCPDGGCSNCVEYMKAEQIYTAVYRKERQGEWEEQNDGTHYCSNCGHDATYNYDGREICGVACTFCGAHMKRG